MSDFDRTEFGWEMKDMDGATFTNCIAYNGDGTLARELTPEESQRIDEWHRKANLRRARSDKLNYIAERFIIVPSLYVLVVLMGFCGIIAFLSLISLVV